MINFPARNCGSRKWDGSPEPSLKIQQTGTIKRSAEQAGRKTWDGSPEPSAKVQQSGRLKRAAEQAGRLFYVP